MDDEQPPTGMSGSLSVVRAAGVLALFVAAVAILVAVGTRPSVSAPSSAQTTVPTTTPTTVPGAGGSTTTTAPATTTTTHHGKKGSGSTTTATTVPPNTVSVVVANATSTNGLAAHYSTVIGAGGWSMKAPIDAATSEATSAVYYAPGFQPEAAAIAGSIGVKSTQVLPVSSATPVSATSGLDVIVVIGQDLASTTTTTTASS
jgi:LytR cell envelope-related transcriptional attenuator